MNAPDPAVITPALRAAPVRAHNSWRLAATVAALAAATLAFGSSLQSLVQLARTSDLFSYILLIPFATAYLIYLRVPMLPRAYQTSWWLGALAVAVSAATAAGWTGSLLPALNASAGDRLAWQILSYYALVVGIGFLGLGARWMRAAAFPIFFLGFIVPWPDVIVHSLEYASQVGSTLTANQFFELSGMPVFRDGFVFELAGARVRVAEECSGIRSSVALMLSSLFAGQLLLRSGWHRALLLAIIVPLALLRNGARIWFIAWLCVEYGPQMIHSVYHTQAGPPLFALSLVPLLALLWWLMRREGRAKPAAVKS